MIQHVTSIFSQTPSRFHPADGNDRGEGEEKRRGTNTKENKTKQNKTRERQHKP